MAFPRFQALSEADFDALLSQPFNPPVFTGTFTEDAFREEYWAAQIAVTDALSMLGTQDQSGDGDFCVNDDPPQSRLIAIDLSSRQLWSPELVPLVQSALREPPQPYAVYFEHNLPDERKFYFLVQPDSVTGYMPKATHRQAFGF